VTAVVKGFPVDVTGADISVEWNLDDVDKTVPVTNLAVLSATDMQIQFESPPHSDAVSCEITISSRKHPEYSSVTESMTLVNPVPFVTSISPASGSMAGAETVTIDIANS
jgi:hypothetical protein